MDQIGCYCLTDKTYQFSKSDLTRTVIEQTGNNFNAICTRIQNPLEKIELQIEHSAYTNQKYYVLLPKTIKKSEWSRCIHTTEIGYKKLVRLNRSEKWMRKDEKKEQENFFKSFVYSAAKNFYSI